MSRIFGSLALVGAFLVAFSIADAGDDGAKKKGKKGAGLLTKENAEQMFKKLDGNSDGKLTKDEFLKITDKITDADKAEKARQVLGQVFDRIATDGVITLDQLKSAADKLGQKKKKKDV